VTAETLLRLALVPAAVWLASLAARRWGHSVSGYLGGLPLIGGPITLYLAIDFGPTFAARSAMFTLAAVLAQAAHLMAFTHVARRGGWLVALLSGWTGFAIVAALVSQLALSPASALALAATGLVIAALGLPRPRGSAPLPAIPAMELRLRLVAAFALAALILWSAPIFGPVASGILMSMPITGSIMPPFTLAFHGADAVARLTRGFVVGLTGFSTFFLVVSLAVVPWGIVGAFTVAAFAAVAAALLASRALASR
jgi:hypothetical protein